MGARTFAMAGLLSTALCIASTAAHADLSASATVDTTADLGPVQRDVLGADIEYIGEDAPASIDPIARGTTIARFPGGDDTSGFLWSDPSTGSCATPRFDWPGFASMASRLGIGVMLETNAVRGTPAGNVAWIADARARGLRVPWVGIGNEVWGSWDAGYRTAAQYAADVRANAAAIHARFPDVGVVLEIGTFNEDAWNREAVRLTADVIDAVDYHYYPNHLSPADPVQVAAGADGVAPLLARIRAMLRDEAPARAESIRVIVGEWDGASDPPRPGPPLPGVAYCQWSMSNALFYGAAVGEMLEGGVAAAMFYELQGYRFGAVNGDACTAGDFAARRPKELVMRLWRERFGDRRLRLTPAPGAPTFHSDGPTNWDGFAGDAPVVRSYASLGDGGATLRMVVVNRSPSDRVAVDYALVGFDPADTAETHVLAGDSIRSTNENVGGPPDAVRTVDGAITVDGPALRYVAPAHSVTALVLHRRAADPMPARSGGRPPLVSAATASGLAARASCSASNAARSRTTLGALLPLLAVAGASAALAGRRISRRR